MRNIWLSVIGVIAALALVVGVNLIADHKLSGARVDLTEQNLYSLSPGTLSVLRGLKEPVTLRLFYSRQLGSAIPQYGIYADRVQELLREYTAASGGKVRVEVFDPEPFSTIEDQALGYGLQAVPLDQNGQQVFFGVAGTNLLDDERVIGFLKPEREQFLEFDLTRLVHELSNPQRPVVGVLSALPLDGDPRAAMMMRNQSAARPYAAMTQLRETATIRMLAADTQVIDPEISVLLVAQAQHLPETTIYAIDQFVMRGGKLMAMVDPRSEAEAQTPGPDGAPSSDVSFDLPRLFGAWGLMFDPKIVIGDLNGAWRVRAGGSDRVQAVDFPPWFNIRDGIARDDPATSDLKQVTVASPGALARADGAKIEFKPLLTSSDQSGPIAAANLERPDPVRILASFKAEGGPRVIAARVTGMLKSAFAGPPELAKGQERPKNFPAHIAETAKPANLVVVADTDILADRYWVRLQDFFGQQEATPFSDNGPFVANLIGTLAGGDALIGLRSRGDSQRPFVVVEQMQKQAEAEFRRSEEKLMEHLQDVQKQLQQLRQGSAPSPQKATASDAVVTEEQRNAIEAASKDVLETRQQLRTVQLDLNRGITALRGRLQLLNIAAVPAVLTILAVILGIVRARRRASARA